MKFGLKFVAVFAAAALAVRLYLDHKEATATAPSKAQLGQVHTDDPYATVENSDNALPGGVATNPITEAAYHQMPVTPFEAGFGDETNTSGEEVTTLI